MKHFLGILATAATTMAVSAEARPLTGTFSSIDGGTIEIEAWRGQPVLVVNTASRCGFTEQYDGLQDLYDMYRDQGLVVLAVPSNDFRQELATEEEVKDFCEVNFNLTLPMTGITNVRGRDAHPLYKSLREAGFEPRWNFNKALIGPDGAFVQSWGATTHPLSPKITGRIEEFLN